MGRAAGGGSLRGTVIQAVLGPRPRCDLWPRVSASNPVVGHEGSHQRTPESLGECIRGADDRLDCFRKALPPDARDQESWWHGFTTLPIPSEIQIGLVSCPRNK
jgi:hypothetical protein